MGKTGKVLKGCLLAGGLLVLSFALLIGLYIGWRLYANDRADTAAAVLCAGIRVGDRIEPLLAKAEAYLLDNQPIIPLDTPSVNWMKKPYVKGMYPNPGSLYPWKYVYIERDQTKWDYGTPSLDAK